MRPIVTDGVAWSVCRSVGLSVCRLICQSITVVNPAKTAESMEMPFELWAWMGPMNHVLNEVKIPRGKGQGKGCPS